MLDIGGTWWLFIALTLAASVWLLFFAYQHVEYDHYLWWQVALGAEGDASRSLRSAVLLCVLAFALGLHQLFRPAIPKLPWPTPEDLNQARDIAAASSSTNAFLALTGDKHLLFSPARDAFLMFGQTGGSLVAMGDPVGNPAAFGGLVWQFHELADRHHKRLGFYQVSSEHLPLFIDSGMRFARLGEEALVPLADFRLEGGRFKDLRQAASRAEREGLEFSIIPAVDVPAIELALRAVSDDWLRTKNVGEKRFSLGFYQADYIRHFPVAIVRQGATILAFANILATANKTELSVDLMRHLAKVPHGTMDFLFAQLLLWGKAEGFRYFNLGMAPLAGFTPHRLAPAWTRMGSLLFRHGERFYNFQGVHRFKNKYRPEWRPRYLAYSGLFSLIVLFDIAILIAGGSKGLFRK
jgi:phosphatidylglycerol lysyltransferase